MPVIQTTRETAQRMECINHLKQLSMACVNHEAVQGHFPTGGWSNTNVWIGDPDCGYGRKQPGGWTYNILPFIENKALHDRGTGMSTTQKRTILAGTAQTVLGVYYCPTRREPILCPNAHFTSGNIDYIASGARTDYAANAGIPLVKNDPEGATIIMDSIDGIIFVRSIIVIKDIRDGTSHTYLLGEKYLTSDHYKDGLSNGDKLPLFANYAVDWERNANTPPERDRPGNDNITIFGSATGRDLTCRFATARCEPLATTSIRLSTNTSAAATTVFNSLPSLIRNRQESPSATLLTEKRLTDCHPPGSCVV